MGRRHRLGVHPLVDDVRNRGKVSYLVPFDTIGFPDELIGDRIHSCAGLARTGRRPTEARGQNAEPYSRKSGVEETPGYIDRVQQASWLLRPTTLDTSTRPPG